MNSSNEKINVFYGPFNIEIRSDIAEQCELVEGQEINKTQLDTAVKLSSLADEAEYREKLNHEAFSH